MIKNILKGMVIGIANIIPGVSGGTMMVAMGIYDKLIHCITHLFSELKKSILFLLPIAIGMGIAVVGSAFGLEYLFSNFPLQTNLLFIGLIIGGLPAIWKNVKGNKIKAGHIIAGLIFFAIVVAMAVMGETEGAAADMSFNLINVIKLLGVGVVAAATMVIPGVSGSMMLLLMGYYNPILTAITDFISNLVAFDMKGIMQGVGVLAPFGIGVVVGIFAIAKLIEIIFAKFPLYAFWAIIGLIVASPIAIIAMNSFPAITFVGVLTAAVALVIGFVIAMKLGE
jgi:putative membrane protein